MNFRSPVGYAVGPYLFLVMMTISCVVKSVPEPFCPRAVMTKCPSQNRNQRECLRTEGKLLVINHLIC